jgi:hypothetical protein
MAHLFTTILKVNIPVEREGIGSVKGSDITHTFLLFIAMVLD